MCPVLDVSSFVPIPMLPRRTCLHSSSILTVHIRCRILAVSVFRKPLFTIIMAPKHKSSDASSASKPKRSCDVLSVCENVKILDMIEIKKKNHVEIARLYGENKKRLLCSALMERHDFYYNVIP